MAISVPNLRVLCVDDDQDSADSLAMLLELVGFDPFVYYDARAALAEVDIIRPDAAILDLRMPGMNGYEVAKKIREQPWGKSIVLVALTGWGQAEDRQRSREAGFDHHMIKPMEPEALLKLLTSLND